MNLFLQLRYNVIVILILLCCCYSSNVGPNDENLSLEFAVHLTPDSNPLLVAQELNLEYVKQIGTLKCHHLFRADDRNHASSVNELISQHPSVMWFDRQVYRKRSSRTVIDSAELAEEQQTMPYHKLYEHSRRKSAVWLPKDPLFDKQWHLHDIEQHENPNTIDMNLIPAWQVATGVGSCVAIVDDGILHLHSDLKERYIAENSYNFNGDNTNILPNAADPHGTMCAGAATASSNDVCGVGVAFEANVSGLRILGGSSHDAMEAAALTYKYHDNHIFSNSWGPTDDGMTLEAPGPLTQRALIDGTQNGRHGLGSIYVWAAGNGAKKGDNCNYDGYASSRYVLTVGAVDYLGHHPFYSELCAAIIVSAPSTGGMGNDIITTDMHYGCATKFSGTSAAAPLVAGVVALMLEVNPLLTWRDVHHIMVHTARRNDVDDIDWELNGSNKYVNHKYGFGLVDAYAAVTLAKKWNLVGKEVSYEGPVVNVDKPIPDNSIYGIISTVEIHENIKLEHVEVVFTATHPVRADLRVVLYSPYGTPSYLSELHGTSSGFVLQVNFGAKDSVKYQVVKAKFGATPTSWLPQAVTAPLVLLQPVSVCSPTTNPTSINGSIVAIPLQSDDSCLWTSKIQLAQEAGAAAVLIININGNGYELDGYDSAVDIPAVMVGKVEGTKIMEAISTTPHSVTASLSTTITTKTSGVSFREWVFSTVHSWDEESKGNWSLEVYDMHESGTGTFNNWQLRLHGTNITQTNNNENNPNSPLPNSNSTPSPSNFNIYSPHYIISLLNNNFGLLVVIIALTALMGVGWYLINQRRHLREHTASTISQQEMTVSSV